MDKFPLSIAKGLGVIVYKYLEGSVKRSLERELNVPERSDCEFNGWRILLMETCENAQAAEIVWGCADCSRSCMGSCVQCDQCNPNVVMLQFQVVVQHHVVLSLMSIHLTRLETRTKEFIRCMKDFFV